jgi:chemotaxis-related protein WspB
MLLLLFKLGDDRYALETKDVVEVLPLVNWKTIPGAPAGVAGVFNYHGAPVPLIDLAELALGTPSRARMSTRIVLVNYVEEAGGTHLLGLLTEHVAETIRREEADFADPGVATPAAPYLGPVTTDARGIIQRVEVRHLLPAGVREILFRQPLERV